MPSKVDPLAGLPAKERKRIVAAASNAAMSARAGFPFGQRDAPADAAYDAAIAREVADYRTRHGLNDAIRALREVLEAGEYTFSAKVESALIDVERAGIELTKTPTT